MDSNESRVDLKNIKITDDFWSGMQNLVTDVVIPFQERVLNDEITTTSTTTPTRTTMSARWGST